MTAPRVWVGNWVIPVRALYKWSNSQSPEKQNRYSNFDDLCQYFSNTAVQGPLYFDEECHIRESW
jgi:hypothetical protein